MKKTDAFFCFVQVYVENEKILRYSSLANEKNCLYNRMQKKRMEEKICSK